METKHNEMPAPDYEAMVAKMGCPLWARKADIRAHIANVPDNWLLRYMVGEPRGFRKMAEGDGGVVLFHAPTILMAVECGTYKRKYNYTDEPSVVGKTNGGKAK